MIRPLTPLLRRLRARWHHLLAVPRNDKTELLWRDVRSRHPRFVPAVAADARIAAARRGERSEYRSKLDQALQVVRLMLVTEAFFAQVCYRAKTRCRARRIPFVPVVLDHLSVITGQVSIGDPVVIVPGVFIPHGQVCIGGITQIATGAYLAPFISVGLVTGNVEGPTIGEYAMIGTGARVLGPVVVGAHAVVGANAVVVRDVSPRTTVVGSPARPVG